MIDIRADSPDMPKRYMATMFRKFTKAKQLNIIMWSKINHHGYADYPVHIYTS